MVDKILHTSDFITGSLSPEEHKMFSCIKRDIHREIAVPKNADYLMIDVICAEYIKYVRALNANLPRIAVACAKAMREYLSELNLTPKSRAETNTASTLSTIFKVLNSSTGHAEDTDAEHTQEI